MQFVFNSLAELTEFLEWVNDRRNAPTIVEGPGFVAAVVNEAVRQADEIAAAFGDDSTATQVQDETIVETASEPAKRKRRTKAEMEAARAAEQAGNAIPAVAATPSSGPATGQSSVASNPFAASGESAGGATPFDQARAAQATAPADPPAPMDAKEHLDKCREFIAAKGLPAYNETFAKAGLTANVLAFTAEQRAQHAAVLAAA